MGCADLPSPVLGRPIGMRAGGEDRVLSYFPAPEQAGSVGSVEHESEAKVVAGGSRSSTSTTFSDRGSAGKGGGWRVRWKGMDA